MDTRVVAGVLVALVQRELSGRTLSAMAVTAALVLRRLLLVPASLTVAVAVAVRNTTMRR